MLINQLKNHKNQAFLGKRLSIFQNLICILTQVFLSMLTQGQWEADQRLRLGKQPSKGGSL